MLSSDSCFFLINSREYVWTIILAWIWLRLFFLLGNRGRLGLLACSVLVAFPIWQADRFPSAAVEARAVVELFDKLMSRHGGKRPRAGDELPPC